MLLIFIHEWWDLQFKVDSEQQVLDKLSMAILFTFIFLLFLIIIFRHLPEFHTLKNRNLLRWMV